jgi:uncharacterized membrane protein
MKAIPELVLALIYWLHMLATIVWLGGLSSMALLVIPAARRTLSGDAYSAFLGSLQVRLQQVGWMSLVVLGATGMFQLSANPHYSGLLSIDSPWAVAILIKHVLVIVMVVTSVVSTWVVLPAIRRAAVLRSAGKLADPAQAAQLERREAWLLWANLALSVAVLALTAFARSV